MKPKKCQLTTKYFSLPPISTELTALTILFVGSYSAFQGFPTNALRRLVFPDPAAPQTYPNRTFRVTFPLLRSECRGFVTFKAAVVGNGGDEDGVDEKPRYARYCKVVRCESNVVMLSANEVSYNNGCDDARIIANLHCASQPCRVTAPASFEMVVSGNPCSTHGQPGDVLNKSSSSSRFSAPSWS